MSKYFLLIIGICACLFSCTNQSMEFNDNQVIAHRGAWKTSPHPQNSLASLQEAFDLGCTGSEFDVWMTSDGILVVNHDADHHGMMIEETTYADLLKEPLSNGEKIPTVEEYLTYGMKQNKTKLIFEIKPSSVSKERGIELAEKSVAIVKKLGAEKWVDYITFGYEMGLKVISLDPEANVAYLMGDKTPQELKDEGFFGFDYNIKKVKENPQWIREAHDLGLTVNVWTVNNEEDMKWLLDQNVEFISTDEPELLFSLINQ